MVGGNGERDVFVSSLFWETVSMVLGVGVGGRASKRQKLLHHEAMGVLVRQAKDEEEKEKKKQGFCREYDFSSSRQLAVCIARRASHSHLQGVHPNPLLIEVVHKIPARTQKNSKRQFRCVLGGEKKWLAMDFCSH